VMTVATDDDARGVERGMHEDVSSAYEPLPRVVYLLLIGDGRSQMTTMRADLAHRWKGSGRELGFSTENSYSPGMIGDIASSDADGLTAEWVERQLSGKQPRTREQVIDIARVVLGSTNEKEAQAAHVKVCQVLSGLGCSPGTGVMALLWTAINALQQNVDGLSREDAEGVLIALLRGPQ
jgi:hypothetical protein